MTKTFRSLAVLAVAVCLAGAMSLAESSGQATYKAKCAMCHGADGLAATPMGKNMKILSFKAPEMVKASDAQFIASTKNGKGKMPAYNGKLTDAQIKDVVSYIRTLQ